jgi:hypothetical protein
VSTQSTPPTPGPAWHLDLWRSSAFVAALLCFFCAALVGGCSDKTGPAMVSGKVEFEGQRFTSWVVHFVPKRAGVGMSAPLQADGTFRLPTRLDPNETYIAYFTHPEPTLLPEGGTEAPPPTDPPIPPKYRSDNTSDLTVEVTPGKNFFRLELHK